MTNKLPLHNAVDIVPNPPSTVELSDLQVNDFVKLGTGINGQGSEAFWVVLDNINGNTLSGVIDNKLLYSHHHGYLSGQRISFDVSNVLQFIYNDGDDD